MADRLSRAALHRPVLARCDSPATVPPGQHPAQVQAGHARRHRGPRPRHPQIAEGFQPAGAGVELPGPRAGGGERPHQQGTGGDPRDGRRRGPRQRGARPGRPRPGRRGRGEVVAARPDARQPDGLPPEERLHDQVLGRHPGLAGAEAIRSSTSRRSDSSRPSRSTRPATRRSTVSGTSCSSSATSTPPSSSTGPPSRRQSRRNIAYHEAEQDLALVQRFKGGDAGPVERPRPAR